MSSTEAISQTIPLELIRVATPCRAEWDKMTGDDKVRFCGSCAKNVYNLSAMTRDEAERLMGEKEGNLCVRLHRREDGTVLTSDCPVGISTMQRRGGRLGAMLATLVAAVVGALGFQVARAATITGTPEPIMGEAPIVMGRPLMGKPIAQLNLKSSAKAKPVAKPVKIPSKQKKSYGNRAPRKTNRRP